MTFQYDYPLFRPPAEANNLILQVTLGCSHNLCSFCSMYKDKKYKIKNNTLIFKEIDTLANMYPNTIKIFLADGDALSIPYTQLLQILEYLNKSFLKLRRISVYATSQNVLNKTNEELKELSKYKLNLIYFGIETGNDNLLVKINKGVNQNELISSLNKASNANIKISATIILGIGGKEYSKEHIKQTAYIINNTNLNYLSTLQLGLEENEAVDFYKNFKIFTHLNDFEILDEQKKLIELLNVKNKVIFRSNHASNALHLSGTLPKDKEKLLEQINIAISKGDDALVPKILRGF